MESGKKKTKPRRLDLYEIFCGVLYVLKSGCQWRMLPKDFPKWQIVYYYCQVWNKNDENKPSLLELVWKKLVEKVRIINGRKDKTNFCIIDSQSVKNTDIAKEKGYDAGKKISGIKRHIAVDTQGLPHAIHVTTAEVTDRNGAITMIKNAQENLSVVKNILVDGGYTGEKFAKQIKEININTNVEVVKRNELHTFVVLPKRWVVERTFAWLESVEGYEKIANENLILVYKWLFYVSFLFYYGDFKQVLREKSLKDEIQKRIVKEEISLWEKVKNYKHKK